MIPIEVAIQIMNGCPWCEKSEEEEVEDKCKATGGKCSVNSCAPFFMTIRIMDAMAQISMAQMQAQSGLIIPQ